MTETGAVLAVGMDNRVDFCRELAGSGERPSAKERQEAAALKLAVLDGLARAVQEGVPKADVVLWADADLGEGALLKARAMSIEVAVAVEKPGPLPAGLALDATADAWSLISKLDAQYAAARLGYNFADPPPVKENAQEQLRMLASRCRDAGKKLAIDLAPRASPEQIAAAGGSAASSLRAQLLIEAMRELQDASVEPAVWACVPPRDELAAATVAAQAYVDDRTGVTVLFEVGAEIDPGKITPGPSREDRAVARLAARTVGVGGVLAGPDAYFSSLARLHQGLIGREAAVQAVAGYLKKVWDVYAETRRASGVV